MKPREHRAPKPLVNQPKRHLSEEEQCLKQAQEYHANRRGKTQRQLLIEAGIITPRSGERVV